MRIPPTDAAMAVGRATGTGRRPTRRHLTAAPAAALVLLAGIAVGSTPASAATASPTVVTRVAGFPVDVAQMPPGTGTLALPAGSVGNLVLVAVDTHDVTATGISSPNTTGWQQVTHVEDTQAPRNLSLWIGRVKTAGTDTLTVTYSGPVTSSYTEISADELTTDSLSATSWALVAAGNKMIEPSGTAPAVTWPALTTAAGTAPQAYWGFGSGNSQNQNQSASLGSPAATYAGFMVTLWPGPSGNLTILNTKPLAATTYAPADGQSPAGNSTAVGVIVTAQPASSTPPAAAPPGPPTNVTATAGVASATVSFTPPASDGGTPITGYTVTATDLTKPARGGQTANGDTSPITVTGLTPGDNYTFTVTAQNNAGTSQPSTSTTPATKPRKR